MAIISGLHAGTGSALQLDAGILLTGVAQSEIEGLNPEWNSILKKGVLGATKGGASFTATPEFRSLLDGVNGSRGNYKNGQVIDSWDVTLKTTISEMTAANIQIAMAGNSTSNTIQNKFHRNEANVGIVKKDAYFNDVMWIGTLAGKNTEPMIILLKNVLNTNGVNFTAEDKGTGAIELELKAHFDVTKPDEVPFFIYTPKGGDS